MVLTPPVGSADVPDDWTDTTIAAAGAGGSLLRHSAMAPRSTRRSASEDPAEIMRRAGAVYRQMVLASATS